MRVNVIISVEREIEVDDKFQVMDLSECDDGWDEIPDSLSKDSKLQNPYPSFLLYHVYCQSIVFPCSILCFLLKII